ncbi:Crp/Fnr family transcriptional regulator [Bradyrhizobium sp. PMVTL-01]|uniref:Crp/Fnr family transcriptional regulator n=1 Tax=unclassified Bradyrhizobium TaxID=2631580 RepID=UPI000D81350B|nr:MAG: Crp/Fnr family transcriptional regulator [Pseudomonadota bacterium]
MDRPHETLIRNLKEHSRLREEDIAEIGSFSLTTKELSPDEDFIHQGDHPKHAVLVVSGMIARYHLLKGGHRQYLSFHMSGDLPDAQGLFIERMDHALCSIGPACVAFIPHKEILKAFERRPSLGIAIWRETLLDAAIFREAITNNSARLKPTRMAHLFCELFYRARLSKLNDGNRCSIPLTLPQLGETLAMAIASVNRALQQLRSSGSMDFRDGKLIVLNWGELKRLGDFNPDYLHMKSR